MFKTFRISTCSQPGPVVLMRVTTTESSECSMFIMDEECNNKCLESYRVIVMDGLNTQHSPCIWSSLNNVTLSMCKLDQMLHTGLNSS